MGIRFLCPNGHKLNVKTFLAGKRGICPQCDAKFIVPAESGGQVEASNEVANTGESEELVASPTASPQVSEVAVDPPGATAAASASEPPAPAPPAPPTTTPPKTTATAPTEPPPSEVWYVRAANGEQYGPAQDDIMRQWVAEGRVTVDCWVWRTGWPEWKTGGHAITFLNGPASIKPENPTVEAPTETPPELTQAIDALPEENNATALYLSSKRERQARARKVTLLLSVVVVLLFAVLVGVLINNG